MDYIEAPRMPDLKRPFTELPALGDDRAALNIGFNLGTSSGGSIFHLHGHIVPRWNGDNNFMPVLGQTRILPQALESTWERLTTEAAKMAQR